MFAAQPGEPRLEPGGTRGSPAHRRRHDLIVLSDEIHADLVYPDFHHTPLAALADSGDNIVTAVAPSKTFNIPGLGLSALIVPNPEHRAVLGKAFDMLHVSAANPFSIAAFEAAYREGEEWLDKLLAYLQETRDYVSAYLLPSPAIHPSDPARRHLSFMAGLPLDWECRIGNSRPSSCTRPG